MKRIGISILFVLSLIPGIVLARFINVEDSYSSFATNQISNLGSSGEVVGNNSVKYVAVGCAVGICILAYVIFKKNRTIGNS
ncbi:hypothetical protein EYV94_08130 [Puteibacter caeruleilacunae]|nr:hypothetical protein EYV94_08130 [Puteibacter caeruleilacunae]